MKSQPRIVITSGRLTISTALLLKDQGTAVQFEPETGCVYLIKERQGNHVEENHEKTA